MNLEELQIKIGIELKELNKQLKKASDDINEHIGPKATKKMMSENNKAIKRGLDEIRKLKVYNYTFKSDKAKKPHVGVIAQDLKKIFPNAVTNGYDGFLKMRTEDIFYAMINAIKELDIKTIARQKKIKELKRKNQEMDKIIAELKQSVTKLEEY